MAQNEPQRKETPPGPSPNSPPLLFEYQCRSGKFIRLANRIEKNDSVARIESNRNFASASEVTTLWRYTNLFIIIIILLFFCPNWNALQDRITNTQVIVQLFFI